MRILSFKDERENFHTFCHFMAGMITYGLFMKAWPVLAVGVGWELLDFFFGIEIGWPLDRRGFSIGDVIWTIIGGLCCIASLP